jgi:hypothetical protein
MPKPLSRADRLFWYFLDREGVWVGTYMLEKLGGRLAWRTRVSDARKRARLVRRDIVNRQRRQRRGKKTWTCSEYVMVKQKDVRKVKQAA